jgi:hypothetical protein
MSAVPLVLVVGGDKLAVRVCRELHAMHGHRAVVVWMHDDPDAKKFEAEIAGVGTGYWYVHGAPNDVATLQQAGVAQAECIMVLSDNDHLNLQVALTARALNPNVRIVMRQFSRTLGVKLQQNLENSSVLSLASHSAAAFAAASIDPNCAGALQFPDPGGVLTAFATRTAAQFGITGLTAVQAQSRLCGRIVALNDAPDAPRDNAIAQDESVRCSLVSSGLKYAASPGWRRLSKQSAAFAHGRPSSSGCEAGVSGIRS